MSMKQKLEILARETNSPCVTITMNTHRTHPDTEKDRVVLKNLLKEAEERVINEFGKRSVSELLKNINLIDTIYVDLDLNYSLDSLYIFLSNDTKEIIKSIWSIPKNKVEISDKFAVRNLIKNVVRTREYNILLLSQGGAHLYTALNDSIEFEVKNEDFPYTENTSIIDEKPKLSDSKQMDNKVREYFNKIDKAIVNEYNKNELKCVVICTEDNYSKLMQIADRPDIYLGYEPINYNDYATHTIVKQAWNFIKDLKQKSNAEFINEMNETKDEVKIIDNLQDIYQAALDGRADLLIVNQDYKQAAMINENNTLQLIDDVSKPDAIDDITSEIAWQVFSKKGRVAFLDKELMTGIGDIALKLRY